MSKTFLVAPVRSEYAAPRERAGVVETTGEEAEMWAVYERDRLGERWTADFANERDANLFLACIKGER
jgi:hypothetical protein